jgi:hypothetical protein
MFSHDWLNSPASGFAAPRFVYMQCPARAYPLTNTKVSLLPRLSFILFLLAVCTSTALEVEYYPKAAYAHESATFVLRAEPGTAVTVTLGDAQIAESTPNGGAVEFALKLAEAGLLRISQGEESVALRVVRPEEGVDLQISGGFLHTVDGPAILLADHKAAPKHDRRWESLKLLVGVVTDSRPKVQLGTMAGADFFPYAELANLDDLSDASAGFWRHVTAGEIPYEIDAFLADLDQQQGTGVVVIAPSPRDLERGIDQLEFMIKLEWYLQALQAMTKPVFVVAPPLTADSVARYPAFFPRLSVAVRGNLVPYIKANYDRDEDGLSLESWLGPVLYRVRKVVKIK